jgi:4a-hydroxytetrahydrobiopterin dehydratase
MSTNTLTAAELAAKNCTPCEGGVPSLSRDEANALLENVTGWKLTADGKRIRREWIAKNFMAGIDFFQKVAALAEQEGHHPDLHLEGYRNVAVELWTHAIGGISENDVILAAKINEVPIAEKKK